MGTVVHCYGCDTDTDTDALTRHPGAIGCCPACNRLLVRAGQQVPQAEADTARP